MERKEDGGPSLYRRVVNVRISNVDDHLHSHGFLWLGKAGWSLSPAHDLNPVPTDLKARGLTTNIDLDEDTCSLDLLEAESEQFALSLAQARTLSRSRRGDGDMARRRQGGRRSISGDQPHGSAFEHDDLKRAPVP